MPESVDAAEVAIDRATESLDPPAAESPFDAAIEINIDWLVF